MNPFTSEIQNQVASLGEIELIERIQKWLGPSTPSSPQGMGDDCAAIPIPQSPGKLLVTTDPVVYQKHFDDSVAPEQAAAKLLKRNISDIAAMGGQPKHAVISFSFPTNLSIDWLQAFHQGLSKVAQSYSIEINGGDICETSGFLGAFLTLIGFSSGRVLQRKQAEMGSRIYVTGFLGGSSSKKHHAFTPRLDEGQWLANRKETIACTDLSDGLGKDCASLLKPGQAAALAENSLPISDAAITYSKSTGRTPVDHSVNDGEDYELLFAIENSASIAAFESDWRQRFDTPLTCIGTIVERGEREDAVQFSSESSKISLTGYAHFGKP